jgi:hypothetical protein
LNNDKGIAAEWVNPLSGTLIKTETAVSKNTSLELQVPTFTEDIAVRIVQINS